MIYLYFITKLNVGSKIEIVKLVESVACILKFNVKISMRCIINKLEILYTIVKFL